MKAYTLLLPLVGVLAVVFAIVPAFRGGCILIGLVVLIGAWVYEKLGRKQSVVEFGDLKGSEEKFTEIDLGGDALLVSSRWDLADSKRIDMLDAKLSVCVRMKTHVDGAGFVAGVRLSCSEVNRTALTRVVSVTVETGWLLFAKSSLGELGYTERRIRNEVQSRLKTLQDNQPMVLPFEEDGKCLGIVVSTGTGNGFFDLQIEEEKGGATEVVCMFMT